MCVVTYTKENLKKNFLGHINLAEAEQESLQTEIEFVYFKANTFTDDYVDVEILPAVEARLEIRKLQDKLVMKWLVHKAKNKTHAAINDLEKAVS